MEEQDRQFIEALFVRQGEQFQQELRATTEHFEKELRASTEHFDKKLCSSTEEFKRYVSSAIEIVDHKIGLIADGHHAVLDKLDRLEARFDKLEERVDKIGVELEAHRTDTEAHHGIYRVKES